MRTPNPVDTPLSNSKGRDIDMKVDDRLRSHVALRNYSSIRDYPVWSVPA